MPVEVSPKKADLDELSEKAESSIIKQEVYSTVNFPAA